MRGVGQQIAGINSSHRLDSSRDEPSHNLPHEMMLKIRNKISGVSTPLTNGQRNIEDLEIKEPSYQIGA